MLTIIMFSLYHGYSLFQYFPFWDILLTHVYSRSRRRRKSSDLYRRIWIVVSLSGRGVRLVTCRVELVGVSFPVCIQSTLERV